VGLSRKNHRKARHFKRSLIPPSIARTVAPSGDLTGLFERLHGLMASGEKVAWVEANGRAQGDCFGGVHLFCFDSSAFSLMYGVVIEGDFFRNLGLMIITAAALAVFARFLRLPTIVVFLGAGLLLGPATGWIELSDSIDLIAEIGIVLLLFLVGLELSFDKIQSVGKVAIVAGLGQVVFIAAGGYLLCWWLGFTVMESLFLSVALTFSSTVVVVKILTDKKEMDALYGRIAVGIFLVQDLVVIIVLTLLTGLGGSAEPDAGMVARQVVFALGGMVVLLGGVLAASRWVLPVPFQWASASPATLFVWSLGWCFVVVAAAYLGKLSVELGAFFAGLSLAQLPCSRDLQHRIKPLMNFFVAIFFVSLGVRMAPEGIGENWGAAVALSLFVLIGNPLIFLLIIPRFGYDERTSFKTSVTVAQISEFSFIFVAMGLSAGLIGDQVVSITGMVGIATIAASAYMIYYADPLYAFCRKLGLLRIFRASRGAPPPPPAGFHNHIIVVGMNTLGRKIATTLHEKGETVLAIDTDPRKLCDLPCETLHGNIDYQSLLEEHGLADAKLVVSALQIEETNELLAHRCKEIGVPCSVVAIDLSLLDNLLELGVAWVMVPKVDVIRYQHTLLEQRGLLNNPPKC